MRRLLQALLPLLVLAPTGSAAQFADRASLPWRTLDTPHFRFLFPVPLSAWALPVASRFEAVRSAVDALVGSSPAARVTVVMDDPITMSNGVTLPELHEPTLLFLATPPGPRTDISDNPDWGEILSVHEYAHAAHLTRPSRNPLRRALERLPFLPTDVGPIALRAPRWVTEGYATYVEGRLTGSGRPHGVWRAAVLRQWALEGRLPSYAAMSAVDGYRGGSFAYLVGSAYLEWLLARQGPSADSALPHVWRRLTARHRRGFGEAFAGVFRGTPEELYDRFRVDVTTRAVTARSELEASGLVQGDTVQALEWQTGDPAVSVDGSHLAIVLRAREVPSRVVIWSTSPAPPDTAAARREALMRRKDPQDVPAVQWRPRPRKALATLWAEAGGRAYDQPRFLPDGDHVLLTRMEALADGSRRPDLFVWNWKRGGVRRVTHGAAIVSADPTPDGRSAVGVRCLWGSCDVVRVTLADGSLRLLRAGAPDLVWSRPRVSPDGRSVAVAVQRRGRWDVVLLDAISGAERAVGPSEGAQRYDPAFTRDGSSLVVTSETGGIPNLEVVGLGTGGSRPITRVTGAALAPEPTGGSVFFLRLHARGLDLARVPLEPHIGPTVAPEPALAPVVPPPAAPVPPFATTPLPPTRPYGLGHREYRLLPSLGIAGGALAGRLALASSDPVGRLGWLAQGAFGRTDWRGASLRAVFRGVTPNPGIDVFAARFHPRRIDAAGNRTGFDRDIDYRGALGALELSRPWGAGEYGARIGGSVGSIHAGDAAARRLVLGDARAANAWALGAARFDLGARVTAAAGATAGSHWRRLVGRGTSGFRPAANAPGARVIVTRGGMDGGGAFEQFSVGGEEPPLFDPGIMSQQLAMPALLPTALAGPEITIVEGRLELPGVSAFAWGARTGRHEPWQRVVGLRQELDTDPIPLARLPGMHIVIGAGYTLDEKPHRTVRVFGMTSLRP